MSFRVNWTDYGMQYLLELAVFLWREALCRVETAAVTDSYVIKKIIRDPIGDA